MLVTRRSWLVCAAAALAAAPRGAATPPYLERVSVVRESADVLRCFYSGHDGDADLAAVSVQPLADDNSPLGEPFTVDVSSALGGSPDFRLTSSVVAAPWTAGTHAEVTLIDAEGSTSVGRVARVAPFGDGTAPRILALGCALSDPDTIAVNLMGTDAENDVAEFRVRQYAEDGSLRSEAVLDAGASCPWSTDMVSLPVTGWAGSATGTVTAVDACGNESDPVTFRDPVYGSGTPPVVTEISVSRPRTYQVYVAFAGYDREGDEATATIRFLGADLAPLATASVDYTLTGAGASEFFGFASCNIGADAAWVSVEYRDSAGNRSAPALALVPPPWVPGDGDSDGTVAVPDALLAVRIILGLSPAEIGQIQRLDVYPPGAGDGVVDVQDVKALVRIAAGQQKCPPKG